MEVEMKCLKLSELSTMLDNSLLVDCFPGTRRTINVFEAFLPVVNTYLQQIYFMSPETTTWGEFSR